MANIVVPALVKSLMHDRKPRLHTPGQVTRSAWTGKSKILLMPGAEYWSFTLGFREVYTEAEARALRSFCSQLRGQANSFDMPILPSDQFTAPKSTTTSANQLVNGTNITVASAAGILDGMYMSITTTSGHKRLCIVTGSPVGNVITFTPALNEAVGGGAGVEFQSPVARVRNADPDWEYDEALAFAGFGLVLEEAV